MTETLEILKYTIPALIVFFTTYFTVKKFQDTDHKKRMLEFRFNNQKIITPIRLQAYERLTLLLERIAPDSMIMRIQNPNMTSFQLQSEMLNQIRAEFEHNLSQQIYVSGSAWKVVKGAKENLIKLINTCSTKIPKEAPAMELSKKILETLIESKNSPTQVAIDYLKTEIGNLM